MKKILKIILAIFIILIVFISGLCVWQADNIKAVFNSFKYTDDQIDKMIEENRKFLDREIKENYDIVSDFTEEDEAKILSGEMSVEEAVEKKRAELLKTEIKDTNDVKSKTNKIVSNRIIEFYSLKAYYLGQLGQMEAKVKKDYAALPKEKKNLVGKKELVSKYMSVASSLLAQCDAKMAELTTQLEKEIKAVGGDTSIIDTIKGAYENEKNLKKAYYMSKLK